MKGLKLPENRMLQKLFVAAINIFELTVNYLLTFLFISFNAVSKISFLPPERDNISLFLLRLHMVWWGAALLSQYLEGRGAAGRLNPSDRLWGLFPCFRREGWPPAARRPGVLRDGREVSGWQIMKKVGKRIAFRPMKCKDGLAAFQHILSNSFLTKSPKMRFQALSGLLECFAFRDLQTRMNTGDFPV